MSLQTPTESPSSAPRLLVRQLGRRPYQPVWDAMKAFTDSRTPDTPDEFWVVEHDPVYTQGQAGKAEHLLAPGDIPVVQSDRGGQVTYHGPGQLVLYVLVDVRRSKLTVRELVTCLETAIINTLAKSGIEAYAKPDAPGVYVKNQLGAALQTEAKLASLGLRIRKGCSFHGLALNVNMDMTPFLRINPCGYAGMAMTQTSALGGPQSVAEAQAMLVAELASLIGYETITNTEEAA
ncbi:lipoyl(octanoyl) transferase LipB [Aeromonas hydrophila]|uniref:Octanoyltransferase n=1 Tax=Aeromonas hydrophila subsp. hydrophila (strain ATCC 7966 / DSM 30187 / BCRC 13018 / CCUG 14551 / JCM 1027 / KCTC 2358 / NCIMB 9240 / NCTC 8049) TaxID=380703 RepID=LIPB_AERHH|nr:lipoyl(octanoyl) transferase LipB [Aeromonas hydrophila]A0KNA1.1 RecName: Full=Octanoyltransferase; AltName: Full=Lipoate-protein ligase B; AltName: Full=Lipoyl/octanoyl transferase; AltName: Full=Octanoyl-[acyl-carrier-protein]-protein N-octanoyltransferase [Aeromonas hydrophila subsp. hydrophila ATCC 7966]ABK39323.1 lipoate-protein ligase B [Aeromonas hydrophila subsp. hydrophila ATCC 7966]MBS4671826.1 lipoyl(octanoyl) transferase LipB [Aeromonas hydrophila]OOD34241.1 octanoyltransferase [